MPEELVIPELQGVRITFKRRPSALPAEFRPFWRVGALILILSILCRGGKSNLQRLYVLNWALRTKESREEFMDVISGHLDPEDIIVRFDPGLLRALDFAIGERLIRRVGGDCVELTELGKKFALDLNMSKSEVFKVEREYLTSLKGKVTEAKIKSLLSMGRS